MATDYYWQQVLSTAWRETKHPFSRKTAAAILMALGTIFITWLRGGFADVTTAATGYFWIALAPILAALVLFAWNVIEAQATLYAASIGRIAELEAAFGKFSEPNYEAWRHREKLELREAAFLWSEIEPRVGPMPPKVRAWYEGLVGAVQKAELGFVLQQSLHSQHPDIERRLQQERPTLNTVVTRSQLRAFAKLHGYDPIFLRDP